MLYGMDRGVAIAFTTGAGGLLALQAPINAVLGRATGTWQAVFISFVLGTIMLSVVVAFARGGYTQMGEARYVPWYYLSSGVIGAAYITTAMVAVRSLGAGGVVAGTIAGQLTLALIVDHYGLLGVEQNSVTLMKIAGVLMLAVGAYFVIRH